LRNALFAILTAGALFAAWQAQDKPGPRPFAAVPTTGVPQISDANKAFGNIPLTTR
jgi:hypothetical protein